MSVGFYFGQTDIVINGHSLMVIASPAPPPKMAPALLYS